MFEGNGNGPGYSPYPPAPPSQAPMHSSMVNGNNFNGNNSPMPPDRRPSLPPGHMGQEEGPPENSNRHKLMNNRLKTLIQSRQTQKEMSQCGGPMMPQYGLPGTPPVTSASHHSQPYPGKLMNNLFSRIQVVLIDLLVQVSIMDKHL